MEYLETLQGVEFGAKNLRRDELKSLYEQGFITPDWSRGWSLTEKGLKSLENNE
ncbi:MAG: hypothetical protein KAR42_11165 [candidate division Zixibacteria bacterium]|nr:hypothetical protein [candidate division Zixibacteria bacterium]